MWLIIIDKLTIKIITNDTLSSFALGSYALFCNGLAVRGSEHGFCRSVQGSGDLGRTNRVLDIAYHVAVDDQIPVEPLLGNFPYQKILRRHDAAPKLENTVKLTQ